MDLAELYRPPQQQHFLYPQSYVEGCLLGAAACPEIPLPNVWLPWVIKQHKQIKDVEQADAISDTLFAFFKHCLSQMHTSTLSLPRYAIYSDSDNSELSNWCEGLLFAHAATEKCWQHAWQLMHEQQPNNAPKMAKDLKHCLSMFTTFANPQKALENASNREQLKSQLPIIANSLQTVLNQYVEISGTLAAFLPNQFETYTKT